MYQTKGKSQKKPPTISCTHGKRKRVSEKSLLWKAFSNTSVFSSDCVDERPDRKKIKICKNINIRVKKPKKTHRTQFLLPNLSIYERYLDIFLYFPQTLSPQTNCRFQKQASKQGVAMWPILPFILIHCLVHLLDFEKLYGDEWKVLRLD